ARSEPQNPALADCRRPIAARGTHLRALHGRPTPAPWAAFPGTPFGAWNLIGVPEWPTGGASASGCVRLRSSLAPLLGDGQSHPPPERRPAHLSHPYGV